MEAMNNASPARRGEWRALVESDTLYLLPKVALIASIKDMAAALLRLTDDESEGINNDRPAPTKRI
jgi:hypothetical protein